MIKATDLRIGNLVLITTAKGNTIKWKVQVLTELGHDMSYQGWPIDGETLILLGFKQHHGDYYNDFFIIKNVHNSFPVVIKFFQKEMGSAVELKEMREVKFIHEIQNIYHSLTQKEFIESKDLLENLTYIRKKQLS